MSNTDIKAIFERDKDLLFQEITTLRSYFDLHIHIRKRRNDRLEILNKAPAFFGLVQESLLHSTIVGLSKLFEQRNKNGKTIYKFLNFLEVNHSKIFSENAHFYDSFHNIVYISSDLIESHKAQLKEQNPVLDNLFIWRDKSFAHSDKKYFEDPESLGEDHPITFKQLRELFELATGILNSYESAYNNSYHSTQATNTTDIDTILDYLHKIEPYKREVNQLLREKRRNDEN
ncbi:hypothetical protein AAV35_011295 [Salimicrobium jeotgali]|uniref:HEPN AbiU2-like domain-containing protein n=1 Tax=Salimicrobium jeotgali TaxID=1230341 RepID=K2G6L0_9BACI|nr:hypothetical protein [Salimicrobium jeotgali]AKG05305.1 hypothetical protein AAV35_011295 [Salimicrobium jeotgali]EKE30828.1 hypothetical protein MJ3_11520 [Salimicrobium jeotgali]MBM7697645.1 hypothetical protein [Salimicrobium jeotgali]